MAVLITDRTRASLELLREISSDLEQYHRVFNVFWELTDIYFDPPTSKIKTAAVYFPRGGGKSFMVISNEFWNSLNRDEKSFVIIHECSHVILDHGMRDGMEIAGATLQLVNMAQDITINEMAVDMYGFERGLLREWKKYCWIDTCFKDPSLILRNQTFEYYLRELIKNPPEVLPELVGGHDCDGDGGYDEGDPDPMAQRLAEELTIDELQKMIGSMGKQDGRGLSTSPFRTVLALNTPSKINFKLLVKKLKRSAKAKEFVDTDSFSRSNRRLQSSEIILPGRIEGKPNKQKLITLVFFDVSGSCMSHVNQFDSVRRAFEEDTGLFDVRSYAFDTTVRLVSPGMPIELGGGTSFNIIETECQRIKITDKKYPDCVVIISDGHGNVVHPEMPNRWVWLLTARATHRYISEKSSAWPIANVTF